MAGALAVLALTLPLLASAPARAAHLLVAPPQTAASLRASAAHRIEPDPTGSSPPARVLPSQGRRVRPLSFEPNQGQAGATVAFLSRDHASSVLLTATEATLVLDRPAPSPGAGTAAHGPPSRAVLSMTVVGGRSSAAASGVEPLPGTVNYLVGRDPTRWRVGIPTYAKVRFRSVYPGVDLVYHGSHRHLEYDFIVAPGADPRVISLAFRGVVRVEVEPPGDLVLHVANGHVRMRRPLVYQEVDRVMRPVPARYVVRGDRRVGFAVAGYDRRRPLVIDPVLEYSTYLGGSGHDASNEALAVDPAGNVYVAGETASTNFPTAGPIQAAFGRGSADAYVAKLSADGATLIYATYLGGSGADLGRAVAVDPAGHAYVVGRTASSDFPVVNPLQPALAGTGPQGIGDGFVAKLDPGGSALVYSTYLGGSADDVARAVAVDSAGAAYVTGTTTSTDFPTANPLQATPADTGGGGGGDAFVSKLSADGSALVYSTYLGGDDEDIGRGIAVDASGQAHVTGRTFSGDFPVKNALQPTFAGVFDGFVSKLTADGSALVYSTYLGGRLEDSGRAVALDAAGGVHIAGFTASTDFPTANPFQAVFRGGLGDAFVARLNPEGTALTYSTYLGGQGWDEGFGIAVDPEGRAHVTGLTESADFPTVNPLQPALRGARDAFVTKLDPSGSALLYSTYLGGSGSEVGRGIGVDAAGDVHVTGETSSHDFPIAGPLQPAFGGGAFDAFVTKIRDVTPLPTVTISASDPSATEAPLTTGSFVVTRTGSTATPLTVLYQVSGTAAGDQDFVALSGSVTVPPGSATGAVILSPLDDAAVESTETVTLTIAPDATYQVGTPSVATVTIVSDDVPPAAKDLVIEALAVSPSSVAAGKSVTASYRVVNRGTVKVTETYTDRIYLSTDATLGAGDVLLGTSHGHTSDLTPNATHSHSQAVTVPAGTPPGSRFLLVEADALGAVPESLEGNNVTAVALTVTPPGKDLVIEALAAPGSVAAGKSGTVSYRVANRGTVKVTETYTDRIYLSTDATLGAGDVLLGTTHGHTSDLNPNATHSHSQAVTVPAGTLPGSRFLLVEADALGVVAESLEGNNVTARPITVTGP